MGFLSVLFGRPDPATRPSRDEVEAKIGLRLASELLAVVAPEALSGLILSAVAARAADGSLTARQIEDLSNRLGRLGHEAGRVEDHNGSITLHHLHGELDWGCHGRN